MQTKNTCEKPKHCPLTALSLALSRTKDTCKTSFHHRRLERRALVVFTFDVNDVDDVVSHVSLSFDLQKRDTRSVGHCGPVFCGTVSLWSLLVVWGSDVSFNTSPKRDFCVDPRDVKGPHAAAQHKRLGTAEF